MLLLRKLGQHIKLYYIASLVCEKYHHLLLHMSKVRAVRRWAFQSIKVVVYDFMVQAIRGSGIYRGITNISI